jgi:hypothetical protein
MGSYKSEEMWISQKKLERLDNALEFRGLGLEDNITVRQMGTNSTCFLTVQNW